MDTAATCPATLKWANRPTPLPPWPPQARQVSLDLSLPNAFQYRSFAVTYTVKRETSLYI